MHRHRPPLAIIQPQQSNVQSLIRGFAGDEQNAASRPTEQAAREKSRAIRQYRQQLRAQAQNSASPCRCAELEVQTDVLTAEREAVLTELQHVKQSRHQSMRAQAEVMCTLAVRSLQ